MNAALQIETPIEVPAPQLQVLASPKVPHPARRDEAPSEGGNPAFIPQKKIRNGKIARLPFIERDMVNRMLRDHIPYEKIVGALDEHGIYVTERNVSNWKTRRGYKEWTADQDRT